MSKRKANKFGTQGPQMVGGDWNGEWQVSVWTRDNSTVLDVIRFDTEENAAAYVTAVNAFYAATSRNARAAAPVNRFVVA